MRLYLDDHDGLRPPRLTDLIPNHLAERRLLQCPRDPWLGRGGWAWSAWGRLTTPPQRWPAPVSYGYFWSPLPHDRLWREAQQAPGRPGYLVCVLHGESGESSPDGDGEAPYYRGRVLRLCFDGSVVTREFPGRGFNAWRLMTDQAVPAAPRAAGTRSEGIR
ncbi:MAG: hypothetical protein ACK47B_11065 [Armatimonadota bacterium]